MADLNLEIISPTGIVFSGRCNMAVIPSVEGEIGVMSGHETIVTILKAGQVVVYDDKGSVLNSVDLNGGFAEMKDGKRLLVLID